MNSTNKSLAGLLLIQALLVGATWWPRSNSGLESRELVALEASDITGITITGRTTADSDTPADSIELVNDGKAWTLSTSAGYPADPEKVEEVLEKLATISVRSPVGTTEASHRAFEVAFTLESGRF